MAYKIRQAVASDLEQLVELDLRSFRQVYKHYGEKGDRRDVVTDLFKSRLDRFSEWIAVAETEAGIEGVLMVCPTRQTPDEFESWEQATQDGTLDGLFDPRGDHLYVVTLSMTPRAAQNDVAKALLARQLAAAIRNKKGSAFFESRLPGFRRWLKRSGHGNLLDDPSDTVISEMYELAIEYSESTIDLEGVQRPRDIELRMYSELGCTPVRLVTDAYEDYQSVNFGVLMHYKVPLPSWVITAPLAAPLRVVVSTILFAMSRKPATARLIP